MVFDRFSAMRPDSSTEHRKRGLKTKGQLGLWLTFARLFQMVGAEGGEGYVLVAEDDSVMSSKLPSFLEKKVRSLRLVKGLLTLFFFRILLILI